MGQQQLLLLVLGIVIVGIAVVAGIQAFSEGRDKAQQDAAVSDAMRIISDVQAWKLKPTAFGGGDNGVDADFAGVTYQALGIRFDALNGDGLYPTVNGCYDLSGSAAGAQLTVFRTDCASEIATVTVSGATTADITWVYATE
jgi:type II secretory pathway pseudopilin PulG